MKTEILTPLRARGSGLFWPAGSRSPRHPHTAQTAAAGRCSTQRHLLLLIVRPCSCWADSRRGPLAHHTAERGPKHCRHPGLIGRGWIPFRADTPELRTAVYPNNDSQCICAVWGSKSNQNRRNGQMQFVKSAYRIPTRDKFARTDRESSHS